MTCIKVRVVKLCALITQSAGVLSTQVPLAHGISYKCFLCRSMIPRVTRLAVDCFDLRLCLSCIAGTSLLAKFVSFNVSEHPTVMLAEGRQDVKLGFSTSPDQSQYYMPRKMVTMTRYDRKRDDWRPQSAHLFDVIDGKLWRCSKARRDMFTKSIIRRESQEFTYLPHQQML